MLNLTCCLKGVVCLRNHAQRIFSANTFCLIRVSAIKHYYFLFLKLQMFYWFLVFQCQMCVCSFDMGILGESLNIITSVVEIAFSIITITIMIIYFMSGLCGYQ